MLLVLDQHHTGRLSGHFSAMNVSGSPDTGRPEKEGESDVESHFLTPDKRLDVDNDSLLLAVYGVIQGFVTDERPEVLVWTQSGSRS